MTVWKKTFLITAVCLIVLVCITGILSRTLLPAAAERSIPLVKERTGIDVSCDKISGNIPFGTVNLSGVKAVRKRSSKSSITTYLSSDNIGFRLGMLPLLRRQIELSSIKLTNSRLTIIKEKPLEAPPSSTASEVIPLKIPDMQQALPPDSQTKLDATIKAGTDLKTEFSQKSSRKTTVSICGTFDTNVQYIDLKESPSGAARLALCLSITCDKFTPAGNVTGQEGTLLIKGHLEDNTSAFVVDLKAKTMGSETTGKPTFQLKGRISNIRTRDFKELADVIGFECDNLDLEMNITCKEGSYTAERSVMNARASNLLITSERAHFARGMNISGLTLSVPLEGTFENPEFDPLGALLRQITGSKDLSSGEISHMLDGLLGGRKKKKKK